MAVSTCVGKVDTKEYDRVCGYVDRPVKVGATVYEGRMRTSEQEGTKTKVKPV